MRNSKTVARVHTHTHTHTHTPVIYKNNILNQKEIKSENLKSNRGITLVALVVTIVVLLILAGVSINLVLGENGLIKRAQESANATRNATSSEYALIDELEAQISEISSEFNGVNKPNLKTGMTPIYFELNAAGTMYETKTITSDASNWYNYDEKKWANAQTKDGSMWVWIPRFAYKVNNNYFDIVFLMGTTDYYYDENGKLTKAVRETPNYMPNTSTEYTVHPAFTDESSIGYKNGGWDKERTGIWVSKFEAGVAGENNTVEEREAISGYNYPVFMGTVPSYNFINIGNAYTLSQKLASGSNNIYGLRSDTDSHMIKNSEWGAAAYLGQSKYGLYTENIWINNVTLEGVSQDVNVNGTSIAISGRWAVTGCSGTTATSVENKYDATDNLTITLTNINAGTANNVRVWNQVYSNTDKTTRGSNTGTVYGIYDMSGGIWERTPTYIPNNSGYLAQGSSFTNYTDNSTPYNTESYKYYTVYSFKGTESSDVATASQANYEYAKGLNGSNITRPIYGDAVLEISTKGTGCNEENFFYQDYSIFPSLGGPFFGRGGYWGNSTSAGLFSFDRSGGGSGSNSGFRAVLV